MVVPKCKFAVVERDRNDEYEVVKLCPDYDSASKFVNEEDEYGEFGRIIPCDKVRNFKLGDEAKKQLDDKEIALP